MQSAEYDVACLKGYKDTCQLTIAEALQCLLELLSPGKSPILFKHERWSHSLGEVAPANRF